MLFKNLFLFKIWRVVKIFIQNLTRCKIFDSKYDAFSIFHFKIWEVLKLFLQNLIFILFFRFGLNDDIFCQP